MRLTAALSFLLCLLLASCHFTPQDPPPQPLKFTVEKATSLFNSKNAELNIDTIGNLLRIRLNLHPAKDFPFPIHPAYHDTLHKTAFRFTFLSEGKVVLSDYCSLRNTARYKNDTTAARCDLSVCTDTNDIRSCGEIVVKIPFYAFHRLRHGKHSVEMTVGQEYFSEEAEIANASGSTNYYHTTATAKLLNISVRFDLNIPPIYKSYVYGYGLSLKNDSTFSPAGMDNTIWNSSYPDLYWLIYYPKDQFYAQTSYQTSTARYEGRDTFALYHYFENDSVGFGVFDHDNLSRDDGLGYWWGNQEYIEKQPIRRLVFGNVAAFDVGIKKEGIVNQ